MCLAVVVPVVLPPIEERRFFASATAPVAVVDGLVGVRVVVVPEPAVTVEGLALAVLVLGEEVVLVAETGFLAAAVVDAVVLLVFLGELVALADGATDVRRAAEEIDGRFFSSSDTDG